MFTQQNTLSTRVRLASQSLLHVSNVGGDIRGGLGYLGKHYKKMKKCPIPVTQKKNENDDSLVGCRTDDCTPVVCGPSGPCWASKHASLPCFFLKCVSFDEWAIERLCLRLATDARWRWITCVWIFKFVLIFKITAILHCESCNFYSIPHWLISKTSLSAASPRWASCLRDVSFFGSRGASICLPFGHEARACVRRSFYGSDQWVPLGVESM